MATVNIHDRGSLERIYPAETYAGDASENDRYKTAVLKGVRIAGAPDADGNFELARATQQVGEESQGPASFLAPFHREIAPENAATQPDPRQDYEAFLDDIIAAAGRLHTEPDASPGPGDARLRGPRQ